MGPLQGSRVKIRGHMIAHRTPLSPWTKGMIHQQTIFVFMYEQISLVHLSRDDYHYISLSRIRLRILWLPQTQCIWLW